MNHVINISCVSIGKVSMRVISKKYTFTSVLVSSINFLLWFNSLVSSLNFDGFLSTIRADRKTVKENHNHTKKYDNEPISSQQERILIVSSRSSRSHSILLKLFRNSVVVHSTSSFSKLMVIGSACKSLQRRYKLIVLFNAFSTSLKS